MRKLIIVPILLFIIGIKGNAQENPDHLNIFKEPAVTIEENYSVKFFDIVSKMDYCKLRVQLENKTSDFLIYREEENKFIYDFGEYKPKSKTDIIKPHSKDGLTLKIDGDNRFHTDTFNFEFNGLYQVPIDGEVFEAENFQLPLSKNEFDVGPFNVKVLKISQETDETAVKFKCTYNGDKIGFINPNKLVVKIESGQEFANDKREKNLKALQPGDDFKFVAAFHIPGKIIDMQFATMHIIWKDTFVESTPKLLKSQSIEFVIDPVITEEKNK